MGGFMSGQSSQEQYWQERGQREAAEFQARTREQNNAANFSQELLRGLETKVFPSFYELLARAVSMTFSVVVVVGILVIAHFVLKKHMEAKKLKHDMEMQRQKLEHDASLSHTELEHKAELKEKELYQQLTLKEKELDQSRSLEEKKLEQDRYIAERKFRIDMGRMCLDAQKEASRHGQLSAFAGSMTNITQNMLMADQSSSSISNICQLSYMAAGKTKQFTGPRSQVRRRGLVKSSSASELDEAVPETMEHHDFEVVDLEDTHCASAAEVPGSAHQVAHLVSPGAADNFVSTDSRIKSRKAISLP